MSPAGAIGDGKADPSAPDDGEGGGGGGGDSGATISGQACDQEADPDAAASVLRRLSKLEYQLSVQDLLGLAERPTVDALPDDAEQDGFRTVSKLQTLSVQHLRAYADVSAKLGKELVADEARRDRVIGCAPEASGCLRSFVASFGELSYRRPLLANEIDALTTKAQEVGLNVQDQFQFAIEVMLTSPNFLFRAELGDRSEGLSTLAPHELASRLSFALWGRGPSKQLLEQAAQGALDTAEGLSGTAQAMLDDPRAKQFFGAFFEQWLGYTTLRSPSAPPPGWSDTLLTDMSQETSHLLDAYAWGNGDAKGKNFLDALTTNTSYLTPALASFYDVPFSGMAAAEVAFPEGHPRENSGLLTHPALISAKSDGDPVAIRGNWLRKTFLCQNLELPAGLLDSIGDELVGLTRIQIIAERNERPACVACHSRIDPIGVGYASFDAQGRFDPKVDLSDYPIAAGFPDAKEPAFDSIAELGSKLRAMPEVANCMANRLFLYTQGRAPERADSCAIESTTRTFIREEHRFAGLVRALVESESFRLRRVPKP
jgi:hypothetical protein